MKCSCCRPAWRNGKQISTRLAESPQFSSLDWDGRVLRMTRRGSAGAGDGLRIVAWTRRTDSGGFWLRWQSPPLTTVSDWQTYWSQAERWAQNPGDEEKKREVSIVALDEWQLFLLPRRCVEQPVVQ